MLISNAATVEPLGPSAAIGAGDLRKAFDLNRRQSGEFVTVAAGSTVR
jgi:hypothetical protein